MVKPPKAGLKIIIAAKIKPKIPKIKGPTHDFTPISLRSVAKPMLEIDRNINIKPTYNIKADALNAGLDNNKTPKITSIIPNAKLQPQPFVPELPNARIISNKPPIMNMLAKNKDKAR